MNIVQAFKDLLPPHAQLKWELVLVGIFKNESAGIVEWINHYLKEGVEHFFLIDNGSTDDSLCKIQEFLDRGIITLVKDDKKWAQKELYNKHFLSKKKQSKWFIVCDLDEFIYARNGFSSIKNYLKSRSERVGMIRIPWKMFGSSGYEKQPESIVQTFVHRCIYDGQVKPGADEPGLSLTKVIIRGKALNEFGIHTAQIKKRYLIENASGSPTDLSLPFHQPLDENFLASAFLHLNHYAIQSKEWFFGVKCTRGDVDAEVNEGKRNHEYFERYDSNELEDTELAEINRTIP